MGEKDAAAASDAAMEGFEELPYMTAAQKRGGVKKYPFYFTKLGNTPNLRTNSRSVNIELYGTGWIV